MHQLGAAHTWEPLLFPVLHEADTLVTYFPAPLHL